MEDVKMNFASHAMFLSFVQERNYLQNCSADFGNAVAARDGGEQCLAFVDFRSYA